MRRLLITTLSLLISTFALGQGIQGIQPLDEPAEWNNLRAENDAHCIGGSTCKERRLRVPLQDRPVIAVRFHAHDQIGTKAEGVLRVKIDSNTVEGHLDIPRRGETFTIEVDDFRGRYLVFEAVNDDEVEISDIAVQYGRERRRDRDDRVPLGMNGGWRAYPAASGCIGGDGCAGKSGDRLTIALDDAPVIGVRFYAHDQIGQRADGRLRVRIDDDVIDSYIDVQRAGKVHEIEVENISGSRLVIEAANDDEVEIKDVAVLYARGRGRGGDGPRGPRGGAREVTDPGKCIGGSDCGGSRARIRIPIYGRAVNNIRFYARDDIGTRAGGELRIRIDDEILESNLDIPREGRTFTIDGNGLEGDYLIIEPAENDEVEVKDIRVRFEEN
ncbi:MAG TPA: hypothetical protein VGD79_11690 [Thermoanaerobaculia bacterium]|jgi:hypothetical protein